MSKDLNHCTFIGRLGRDPEVRYTPQNSAVASFSIACGDDYKDKSGAKVEQTNWIRLVAFGRLADIISQYVKKGDLIHVSGKQVTRKWQNKEGVDQYTTEIIANEMQMLGGNKNSQPAASQAGSAPKPAQPAGAYDDFEDDVPF